MKSISVVVTRFSTIDDLSRAPLCNPIIVKFSSRREFRAKSFHQSLFTKKVIFVWRDFITVFCTPPAPPVWTLPSSRSCQINLSTVFITLSDTNKHVSIPEVKGRINFFVLCFKCTLSIRGRGRFEYVVVDREWWSTEKKEKSIA